MERVSGNSRVEIDVYSGRPNPSWELGPADSRALGELVRRLPHARGAGDYRDGLGFRGFIVDLIEDGNPLQLRISATSISDGSIYFFDEHREVEKFLLSKMPADLRKQLSSALPH
jgi:hypothetical protein